MNKPESAAMGILAGLLLVILALGIFYYLMLDNLIKIADAFHYDLKPVRDNIFWFFVGWDLLAGLSGAIKVYHYARRGKSIDG